MRLQGVIALEINERLDDPFAGRVPFDPGHDVGPEFLNERGILIENLMEGLVDQARIEPARKIMEKNLSMIFLAVVNIVELKSCLLICGPTEKALAVEAFGGEISMHDTIMDLGNRVSRKKEYIPVITKVINEGWKRPQNLKRGLSEVGLHQLGRLEVDPEDPYGNINRIGSVLSDDEDKHYGAADDCEEKKEDAAFVIG